MSKPILVLACGNPSRGDDALGPMLLEFIERQLDVSTVELLTDFQLQIEHALDLQDRDLILFADASVEDVDAFDFKSLQALRDDSYTSHAMSPEAVLQVYRTVTGRQPPAAFLLSIRGERFELGEALSERAADNLRQASRFVGWLLSNPSLALWQQYAACC